MTLACLYGKTGETESPKFTHVPKRRSNQATRWFLAFPRAGRMWPFCRLWDVTFFSFVVVGVDDDDFTLKWPQTQQ